MKKTNRTSAQTAEDRALWNAVTQTVKPLRQRPPSTPSGAPAEPDNRRKAATPTPPPAAAPVTAAAPRLAPLDRRTRARIGRGTIAIDAKVDLHGLTQAMAHRRLGNFLRQSQASGARVVLVITGKGRQGDRAPLGDERGVLRRSVPNWLATADLRPYVVGFETAGRAHGGEGAFYVRIRSPQRRVT